MSAASLGREAVQPELPLASGPRRIGLARRLAVPFAAMLVAGGAGWYGWHWWQVGRFIETTDDAYVGGNVTTLSPHVPGFVEEILVRDNEFVHAGQLLIELDDRDYKAALAHAEAVVRRQQAALADLRAKYALQQSAIRRAEADLAGREAQADYARLDAERYHALAVTSFGSRQRDQRAASAAREAAAAVRAGEAGLDTARRQLAVIDGETAETEASLAQAEADRRHAELDLGYTRIRSPIDGYVGDRAAQKGAYVAAGTALLSIVPARGLWVDANFKEGQLARMRAGQHAAIVADVRPGRKLSGRVLSLAPATGAVFSVIPPENATGNFTKIVQRVPVRIGIEDGAATLGLLRPGLSATVSVDTRASAGNAR